MSTICDLGKQYSVNLPSYDDTILSQHCQIHDKTADLLAFLQKLDFGVSVLATRHACRRVAYENVEDAYLQGLHYAELRFSPNYMAKAFSLNLDEVVSAVIEGVNEACSKFPIVINLIGILSRTYGVKECFSELDALLEHREQLCAIDLAGDELGAPARLFEKHFVKVRDAKLMVTCHAGEADGANSIWDAINLLGASRIGHGVAASKDERLMSYIKEHDIGIESCLTSNYQTTTVLDLSKHPIHNFLERGLAVTLSTDDPGVSNITLYDEYAIAKNVVGLSASGLFSIQENALKQAFLRAGQLDKIYECFNLDKTKKSLL